MSNYAPEYTFNNMDEFYNFLVGGALQFCNPRFEEFFNLYNKVIEKGCNCSKKKRIKAANDAYFGMEHLDGGTTVMLKRSTQALKIVFKDGDHHIVTL